MRLSRRRYGSIDHLALTRKIGVGLRNLGAFDASTRAAGELARKILAVERSVDEEPAEALSLIENLLRHEQQAPPTHRAGPGLCRGADRGPPGAVRQSRVSPRHL